MTASTPSAEAGPYGPANWRHQRLPYLEGLSPLLPGGADKRPMVGKHWQHHPGVSIVGLQSLNAPCICWHIGAAPEFVAIDIDGPASAAFCRDAGCDPSEADTWRIERTGNRDRLKLVFRVTPEQKAILAAGKKSLRPRGGEELAIYAKPGTQIVVIGNHHTKEGLHDDQYAWGGRLPAETQQIPPHWFEFLEQTFCSDPEGASIEPPPQPAPARRPRNAAGAGWGSSGPRQPCPICSRAHSGACAINNDGLSVWCFHGQTCTAPTCSRSGETIIGRDGNRWGFVRSEEHDSFGTRSLFTLHKDRPRPATQNGNGANGHGKPAPLPISDPEKIALQEAVHALQSASDTRLALGDILPNMLAQPLTALADAYPADPAALLLPFLSLTASIVGNRCRIQVKGTWDEPFLLWGMNIAGASSGKSPMADYLLRPLTRWAVALKDAGKAEMARWKNEKDRAVAEAVDKKAVAAEWPIENPPPPPSRELFVMDATLEKIGSIHNGELTFGITSFHDELSTWFAQHQRQGRGGPDQRSNWNSLWNGRTLKVDRQSGESYLVPHTAVSVFGSTTLALHEAQAKATLKANHGIPDPDGMQARFLLCLPESIQWSYNSLEVETSDLLLNFYKGVDSMVPACHDPSQPTMLTFSTAAWEVMKPLVNALASDATESGTAKEQWLGKLRGNSIRLAGILHIIDSACKTAPLQLTIEPETADRVTALVLWQVAQYDNLQALTGGETKAIPEPMAKLLAKGAEWRRKHGRAPVSNQRIRDWRIPGIERNSAAVTEWLQTYVGSDPSGPYGWAEITSQSCQWHPPSLQG